MAHDARSDHEDECDVDPVDEDVVQQGVVVAERSVDDGDAVGVVGRCRHEVRSEHRLGDTRDHGDDRDVAGEDDDVDGANPIDEPHITVPVLSVLPAFLRLQWYVRIGVLPMINT